MTFSSRYRSRRTTDAPPWLRWPASLLGTFFCVTGAAKLPIFAAFASTISAIIGAGDFFAKILAVLVIGAELAGGIALLFRIRVRAAALALLMLAGLFVLLLFAAIIARRPFVCNCFGVIGLHLPILWEMVLDIALVDLLTAVAVLWPVSGAIRGESPLWTRILTWVLLLLAIAGETWMIRQAVRFSRWIPPAPDLYEIIAFAEGRSSRTPTHAARRLFFLINFQDFTCPLCFEDFLSLADSLRVRPSDSWQERTFALLQESGSERLVSTNMLQTWSRETGLPFSFIVAPDSLFVHAHFRKSMIVLTDESNILLMAAEFPMGAARRARALRLLTAN